MEFHYTMRFFQDDADNRTAALDKIVIIDNGAGINPASYNRLSQENIRKTIQKL